jgi:catechol 2,3-dioxygenase-like lactoylglutathione lyase family enzyme
MPPKFPIVDSSIRRTLMLIGAHVVIYTKNAEADRAFFRDVLGFRSVDAGHGWLIFEMPAAEVAFHPHGQNNVHAMYLMSDNLKTQMAVLENKGVRFREIAEEQWGRRTVMLLPGGGEIGLYEPKHPVTFKKDTGGRRGSGGSGGSEAKRLKRR